jgi:hypothetical protein
MLELLSGSPSARRCIFKQKTPIYESLIVMFHVELPFFLRSHHK